MRRCSAPSRKFWLDKDFHSSLWFQQMLKDVEPEKHAEIRGDPTTSGSAAPGASSHGEGLGGNGRHENLRTACGLSREVPAGRPGAHFGRSDQPTEATTTD